MATRTETWPLVNFENPTGLPITGIVVIFTATDPANSIAPQTLAPTALTISQVLNADTYVFSAQAVDSSGPVGTASTETFTISVATTLTVQIPGAITGQTSPA